MKEETVTIDIIMLGEMHFDPAPTVYAQHLIKRQLESGGNVCMGFEMESDLSMADKLAINQDVIRENRRILSDPRFESSSAVVGRGDRIHINYEQFTEARRLFTEISGHNESEFWLFESTEKYIEQVKLLSLLIERKVDAFGFEMPQNSPLFLEMKNVFFQSGSTKNDSLDYFQQFENVRSEYMIGKISQNGIGPLAENGGGLLVLGNLGAAHCKTLFAKLFEKYKDHSTIKLNCYPFILTSMEMQLSDLTQTLLAVTDEGRGFSESHIAACASQDWEPIFIPEPDDGEYDFEPIDEKIPSQYAPSSRAVPTDESTSVGNSLKRGFFGNPSKRQKTKRTLSEQYALYLHKITGCRFTTVQNGNAIEATYACENSKEADELRLMLQDYDVFCEVDSDGTTRIPNVKDYRAAIITAAKSITADTSDSSRPRPT